MEEGSTGGVWNPHPRMILSTLEMRDSMTPILEDTWGTYREDSWVSAHAHANDCSVPLMPG